MTPEQAVLLLERVNLASFAGLVGAVLGLVSLGVITAKALRP